MTSNTNLSVCIIVKNDPHLEKCILSFKDKIQNTELVIIDTGSTDGITQEIAKKYATIFEVYTDCNDPITHDISDFSQARQRSFDLVTNNYVLWLDSDDIIDGFENIAKIIEEFEKLESKPEGVSWLFPYEYAYDNEQKCILRHYRERLFYNKSMFKWVNPVHEVVVPTDNSKVQLITRDDVVYKHMRQYVVKTVESGRNLRILKKYYEKVGDSDARQLYYLGLEYANVGQIQESIDCLVKYISLSGWEDEIVMAQLKLISLYEGKGDFETAKSWALKAITTKEDWCEPYLALSRQYYFVALSNPGAPTEMRNWERCVHFAKVGLSYPPTKTLLFINPLERECEIHKYLNLAYNKLGRVQEALDSVNTGMQKQPNDPNFLNNKKLYEDFLARNKVVENANIIKSNGTIDQNAVNIIQALINAQPIESNKPPKEQAVSSINKLKEEGYLSAFSADIMIPLINKSIDPDKFFGSSFKPDNQFSKNDNGRPIANISTHKENWNIPTEIDIASLPVSITNEQLIASIIMIWKQYIANGEMINALSFLESAPAAVRYSIPIEKAVILTKGHIEKAGTNTNNDGLVIDDSLANTDAAKLLVDNMHLSAITTWSVIDHFKKFGHKIKNCYIREDGNIFVEGY